MLQVTSWELYVKETALKYSVSTKDTILEGIKSNLERRPIGEAGISEQVEAGKLAEKLAGTSPKVCYF